MLVLENGIGSITTLVGPESLGQLGEGDGVTVVSNDAVAAAPAGMAAGESGSSAACGAGSGQRQRR